MTTTKRVPRPSALYRSAAILASAFLLAAGAQRAEAAGAGASSAGTAMAGSSSSSPAASCPAQVEITLGSMTVSAGVVTISFDHTGQNCPSARPALLHVHQNLLLTPHAGSDPAHQWNADLSIGPNHPGWVKVPLLQSADGKCFVQVDAHAGGDSRGQFFPTTTCSSPSQSSPAPSSSAPSSSAPNSSSPANSSSASSSSASSSSPVESSSVPSSTSQSVSSPVTTSMAPSTSQSFLSASASSSAVEQSFFPVSQQSSTSSGGSLASTGVGTAGPLGLAAVLIIGGAWLMAWARRPRRH